MSGAERLLGAISDVFRAGIWHAKRHLLVGTATLVVVAGGVIGWLTTNRGSDPIEQEVRGAVVLLRSNLAENIGELDGSYRRIFRGVRGGDLVGDVVRIVSSGQCWGFEVVFERAWLTTGAGDVRIGDPQRFDASLCRLEVGAG